MAVAALVFSLTTPPIIEAYRCACASGDKSTEADTSVAAFETSAIPACCCADACKPLSASGKFFSGSDFGDLSVAPMCCCASDSEPQADVNLFFVKNDHRPSFTDFQFQQALPSAFMPQTDNRFLRSAFTFSQNLTRIPPHLSSTILLI